MVAGAKARLLIRAQPAQATSKLIRCVASTTPHCQTALCCTLPLPTLRTVLTGSCACINVYSIACLTRARPVAWSAEPVRHHLLHIATDDARFLAGLCLLCILLRKVCAETQLAVPAVARLSRLGRFVVSLAPSCSRRLERGWDRPNERNSTRYEENRDDMARGYHLCGLKSERAPREAVSTHPD